MYTYTLYAIHTFWGGNTTGWWYWLWQGYNFISHLESASTHVFFANLPLDCLILGDFYLFICMLRQFFFFFPSSTVFDAKLIHRQAQSGRPEFGRSLTSCRVPTAAFVVWKIGWSWHTATRPRPGAWRGEKVPRSLACHGLGPLTKKGEKLEKHIMFPRTKRNIRSWFNLEDSQEIT